MTRFRHEIEWYSYGYCSEDDEVCVFHKGTHATYFLRREEVKQQIIWNRLNPFLLPIYQEALTYFPQETQHVSK